MKKKFFGCVGAVLGILVALIPIPALDQHARIALGVLVWAIVWWIAQVLPDYITALFMVVLFIVAAKVPTTVAFSAFSNSTWWLLLAAFGLSLGVTKSGLMRRISLYVLKLFPANYRGQVLGLLVVGTVTAPFIPSMSAKAAMLAPLSLGISDSMGYERKGKQASGLFLAMLTGLRNPGPLFLSASVLGYAFLGQFPETVRAQYTIPRWFLHALLWFVIATALNFIALLILYKPKNEQLKDKDSLDEQLQVLGPISKKEKYMLAVLFFTMVLWITENLHGIPSHVTAILALCFTIAGQIYDKAAFKAELNWDSILFMGVVLGLASVFDYLGINTWIVTECSPLFQSLAANPWLLVIGIGVLTVLLRFIIVSELAFANIFLVFAVPLSISLGINPWVVAFAVYALVNPWFFLYQNPVYMAAFYATDGEMISHGTAAKYCFIYIFICLIALAASIPYWLTLNAFYL